MLQIARADGIIYTEDIIKNLYKLFYGGLDSEQAGRYRDHQVFITGTEYVPLPPADVPVLMKSFVKELNKKKETLNPYCLLPLPTGGWWTFTHLPMA